VKPCWVGLVAAAAALAGCAPKVKTGLDVLQADHYSVLDGKRVGVVTNPTGVDRSLEALPELIARAPNVTLAAILGPEHGVRGQVAAGHEVRDSRDGRTGVPVYSLYGKVRRPTREMLGGIEALLFDMQDTGVRAYTYISTLKEVLVAAGDTGTEVWVLDRPVPINGSVVEGPMLEDGFQSFVGCHEIPLRHGLTIGEFARMVNEELELGASLHVVPMQGYKRGSFQEASGLHWVKPSPNIPTVDTAIVYAGMVLIEGINLSEGRGTPRPFHWTGAPWIDAATLAAELNALRLPGCTFLPVSFTPSASKYRGETCFGVDVRITDRDVYRSVTVAIALIQTVKRLYPGKFEFLATTFDRLACTRKLREAIERDTPYEHIVKSWNQDLEAYLQRRKKFLLYE
jgi:uncharacterized protein YbbC (DUF1343 family)